MRPKEGVKFEVQGEKMRENSDFLKSHSLSGEIIDKGKREKLFIFNTSKSSKLLRRGQVVATLVDRNKEMRKIVNCYKSLCEKESRDNLPILMRILNILSLIHI